MATALENIKSNISKTATPQPSLFERALSAIGIGGTPEPAPIASGSALDNVKANLGGARADSSSPALNIDASKIPQFDPAKIPQDTPVFPGNMPVQQKLVLGNPTPSFTQVFSGLSKATVDTVKGVVGGFVQQYTNPSSFERQIEDSSPAVLKPILAPVLRTIAPIVEPLVTDIASGIVFNTPEFNQRFQELAASGAFGDTKTVQSEFGKKLIDATSKSPAQVVGDTAQAVLGAYMPEIFGTSAAGVASKPVLESLKQGARTGLNVGTLFGTAQVLSSGSTDPKEIAQIYAQNIIGGVALSTLMHSTVPISHEAFTRATKNISEHFDLPTQVYLDAAKVRETFNPSSGVDGIKAKVTPEEADLLRSVGMTEEQFKSAANDGVTIEIPASRVIQISDKPYFAKVKEALGFTPSESTVNLRGEPSVVRNVRPEPQPATTPQETPVPAEPSPTPQPAETPAPAPIPAESGAKNVKTEPVSIGNIPKRYSSIASEVETALHAIDVQKQVAKPEFQESYVIYRDVNDGSVHVLRRDNFEGTSPSGLLPAPEKPVGKVLAVVNPDGTIQNKLVAKTQEQIVKEKVAQLGEAKAKDIAKATKILEPNVRRILGVGAKEGKFERVSDGVYKLSRDGKDYAFIETANAVEALPRLAKDGFKADMVFLDIPYDIPSVKGGNRGVKYDLLSVGEFKTVMSAVSDIVKDEHTPVLYMYSQAVSGAKQMSAYGKVLIDAGFKPIAKGEWQKLFKNGLPVTNVRGKVAQPEGIMLLTKSGKFDVKDVNLNFKLVRPKGYQTEKPEAMLKALIETTTKAGETVLDPFAGSGVTGAAAIKAGRVPYLIERNKNVVENVTKPRVALAVKEVATKSELPPVRKVEAVSQGEPTIVKVYHGTPDMRFLEEFNPNKKGYYKDAPDMLPDNKEFISLHGGVSQGFKDTNINGRKGIFFTDSRKVAQSYADKPAFDNQNSIPAVVERYVRLENPKVIDKQGAKWHATDKEVEQAIQEGHDGIVIKNVRDNYHPSDVQDIATNVVVFSKDQVARELPKNNKGSTSASEKAIRATGKEGQVSYADAQPFADIADSSETFAEFQKKLREEAMKNGGSQSKTTLRVGTIIKALDAERKVVDVTSDHYITRRINSGSKATTRVSPKEIQAVIREGTGKKAPVLDPLSEMKAVFKSRTGMSDFKQFYANVKADSAPRPANEVAPVAADIPKKDTPAKETAPAPIQVQEKPLARGQAPSTVARSIEADAVKKGMTDSLQNLAGYDPVTVKEQANLVSELIASDMEKVKRIVKGAEQLPENVRGAAFIAGVEKYAQDIGDIGLLQDLASSPIVSETSRYAQELRLLQERHPESPVELIRQVRNAREKAAEKTVGQPVRKARTAIADDIKAEIKKTIPKRQSWEEFISSIEC